MRPAIIVMTPTTSIPQGLPSGRVATEPSQHLRQVPCPGARGLCNVGPWQVEVLQNHNPKAAICADCHTSHDIENPVLSSTRLVITKNCGSCHQEQLQDLPGDLSRAGRDAGLRLYGQVFRLPWKPYDPAGRRPTFDRVSGQPARHLSEMPCQRHRGVCDLPAARQCPRLPTLSLSVARREIHDPRC